MSQPITPTPSPGPKDPVARRLAAAALLVALIGTVFAMVGAGAAKQQGHSNHGRRAEARFKREINARLAKLKLACPVSNAVDLGTWCLESTPYRVPVDETGKNDYLYATQKCVAEGGWLPSAAQLIGAAPKVALKSTIDDFPGTSGTSETPEVQRGIKDEREMTGDLFTIAAGSSAAGSEGVSAGSRGASDTGEPDPVPMPADPLPGTLNYVTVYDNHDLGGFAGGKPVGTPESFRCAYAKIQGKPRNVSSRS